MTKAREHYSYRYYRDPNRAREYDGDRYGGATGQWFHELEVESYLQMIAPRKGQRALDLGSGTGKLALPLESAGCRVLATDSSPAMLLEASRKAKESKIGIGFAVMDGHNLALPDGGWDIVVCSRVLMHVVKPERLVAELCRVSRGKVVFDFPPSSSWNLLKPFLMRLKKRGNPGTHPYKIFGVRWVKRELRRQGFRVKEVRRLLFLPYFVHRGLASPRLSSLLERLFRLLGLTRLWGAPVLILAVNSPVVGE